MLHRDSKIAKEGWEEVIHKNRNELGRKKRRKGKAHLPVLVIFVLFEKKYLFIITTGCIRVIQFSRCTFKQSG